MISLSLSLSLSLFHTHTHTLSRTHSLSLSLPLSHARTHSLSDLLNTSRWILFIFSLSLAQMLQQKTISLELLRRVKNKLDALAYTPKVTRLMTL